MASRRPPQRIPKGETTGGRGGCLRGCLISIGLLAVLGAGLLGYAQRRWEVILPAPAIPHTEAAPEYGDLRLVVRPQALTRIQLESILSNPSFAGGAPPPWLARLVTPHELAVLAEVDYRNSAASVALYLSEKRGGPLLKSFLDRNPPGERVPWLTWEEDGFERVRRGAMVLRGRARLPVETMLEMSSRWLQSSRKPEPLPLEGGRFAELVLDNRDGHAYALLALLLREQEAVAPGTAQELVSAFEYVAACRIWADVVAPDTGLLNIRVELREETREFAREADEHLYYTSERMLADLSAFLSDTRGVNMGRLESAVDDGVYTARYEIEPFSGLYTERRRAGSVRAQHATPDQPPGA